ncbi:MAG: AraC family transcriptional regulator, partial [Lachnospiraceae bacterium]|nr:AraC family transcriptional regulator [Lachnospiraceae bacterium]
NKIMEIENTLQLFFDAVRIPACYFRERQLIKSYTFRIQDFNLPLLLAGSVQENLPGFWYSSSPEYMYFAGIHFSDRKEAVFLGPILLSECSLKQAQEICARLGRKPKDAPIIQRYFDKTKARDIEGLLSCLRLLGHLLNIPVPSEIPCVPFQWNIPYPIRDYPQAVREASDVDQYVEDILLSCVRSGNTNALLRSMDQLFYSDSSVYGNVADINDMRSYILGANMIASRTAVIAGVNYHVTNRISGQYIDQIQKARSASELSYLFIQCFREYTDLVSRANELPGESPIVKQVQQHIREHCGEKLSSKDLAAQFHVNLSYLCTLFKKETGMTINDCIQREKVREARRLLEGSRFSVAQIGEALNFSSESYFCAVFKKITGMTPQACRREMRK